MPLNLDLAQAEVGGGLGQPDAERDTFRPLTNVDPPAHELRPGREHLRSAVGVARGPPNVPISTSPPASVHEMACMLLMMSDGVEMPTT